MICIVVRSMIKSIAAALHARLVAGGVAEHAMRIATVSGTTGDAAAVFRQGARKRTELYVIIGNIGHAADAPLPPRYVFWQIEQHGSSHFVPSYLRLLRHADVVWEFSSMNYAKNHVYAQLVPVERLRILPFVYGGVVAAGRTPPPAVAEEVTPFDVLFYGGMNPRRHRILQQVAARYDLRVKVIFEAERDEYIRKCKIVLNLHYYDDDAALELARFNEIVPFGKLIISERGVADDWFNARLYSDAVEFVDTVHDDLSNLSPLLQKLTYFLHDDHYGERMRNHAACCDRLEMQSAYLLQRAMMPLFATVTPRPTAYPLRADTMYCVHVLEAHWRMSTFRAQPHVPDSATYDVFPAGCSTTAAASLAAAHRHLVWNARRLELPFLTVFDTSCVFPPHFRDVYTKVVAQLLSCHRGDGEGGADILVGRVAPTAACAEEEELEEQHEEEFEELRAADMFRAPFAPFIVYTRAAYDSVCREECESGHFACSQVAHAGMRVRTAPALCFRCPLGRTRRNLKKLILE